MLYINIFSYELHCTVRKLLRIVMLLNDICFVLHVTPLYPLFSLVVSINIIVQDRWPVQWAFASMEAFRHILVFNCFYYYLFFVVLENKIWWWWYVDDVMMNDWQVSDVNDHRPQFQQDQYNADLVENNYIGATVLTVRCSLIYVHTLTFVKLESK